VVQQILRSQQPLPLKAEEFGDLVLSSSHRVSRRSFLQSAAVAGVATLPSGKAFALTHAQPGHASFFDLMRPPDLVTSYEEASAVTLAKSNGTGWSSGSVSLATKVITTERGTPQVDVVLNAPKQPVSRLHLRWQVPSPSGLRILGDHWERAYGDLEWRGLDGGRVMPWYFLAQDGPRTHGYGVAAAPKAMAFWRVDQAGVSLWLDVRNGGSPVLLGDRELSVCTLVTREGREGESAWQAAREFVKLLSSNGTCPLKPETSPSPDTCHRTPGPFYGANNWYYAYGENCSADFIVRDASLLADLTAGLGNRPFQVIDEGWDPNGGAGPWRTGNAAFPDMPGLAAKLKGMGVRPGIWMRPLVTKERCLERWTLKRPGGGEELVLDPSIPEVREHIRADVAGLVAWGYDLVKHDYSTADLLGRWGSGMGASITEAGWAFYDRSRTTAEIVRDFYQAIREGAGEQTVLLGCNTIGHLGAGIFDVDRVGDDTSGREWDRTRRMGVNALAFRSVQHGAFFAADADCVGITNAIPWQFNRQWLDLLSRSGTPLFVSAAPDALGDEQRKALREAFARAAVARPTAEPLDWLETITPERWRTADGVITYDWFGSTGDTSL
jgi:alpha-galactosidase